MGARQDGNGEKLQVGVMPKKSRPKNKFAGIAAHFLRVLDGA